MSLTRAAHRRGPRRHVDPVRRPRRDHLASGRGRQPRHRGIHARAGARRLRRHRRDGQPLDRGCSAGARRRALRRWSTRSSCSAGDRTSSPPVSSCCSWPRPHLAVRRQLRAGRRSTRSTPVAVPGCPRSRSSARSSSTRTRSSTSSYVARAGAVVVPVPHPLGPAACGPPVSASRCWPPTATASRRCSYAAVDRRRVPWPASAARSSRPPTPTPGSRTWSQGRGFIAVAVVIFAARSPFKVMAGAVPVRRRPRAVAGAAGPRLRHQPVRARRRPLRPDPRRPRRSSAAAARPTHPKSLKKVFEASVRAGDARGRARSAPHPSSHPSRADPAQHPHRVHRKEHACADAGSQRLLLALAAHLLAAAVLAHAPQLGRRLERRRSSSSVARQGRKTVGFIFVGPKDDFGYNQAAYEGVAGRGQRPSPTSRSSRPRTCPRTTTPRRAWRA